MNEAISRLSFKLLKLKRKDKQKSLTLFYLICFTPSNNEEDLG